jgi:hypothetical protein
LVSNIKDKSSSPGRLITTRRWKSGRCTKACDYRWRAGFKPGSLAVSYIENNILIILIFSYFHRIDRRPSRVESRGIYTTLGSKLARNPKR